MMDGLKPKMLASSLVLVMGVGLAACARDDMQQRSEAPTTQERTAAVREEPQSLDRLPTGQPLSFYTGQFNSMGYEVRDVDYAGKKVVYDLARDNQYYRVTLDRPESGGNVSNVAVREMPYMTGSSANQNQDFTQVRNQVMQTIKPGKKATSYIPQLEKIGSVVEYKGGGEDAKIRLKVRDKEYNINMNVDPANQMVKNVKVDEAFWGV